jgi:hypothetical protein
VRDFPKSEGYLVLLTARGTTSRFSDPALLSRDIKVRELKARTFQNDQNYGLSIAQNVYMYCELLPTKEIRAESVESVNSS